MSRKSEKKQTDKDVLDSTVTITPKGVAVLEGREPWPKPEAGQGAKPSAGPDTCRGESGPVPKPTSVSALLDRNAAAVRSMLNPGTPDKCRD